MILFACIFVYLAKGVYFLLQRDFFGNIVHARLNRFMF